ncbi:hypothetical protein MTO96_039710, partial [Rhipicephalus appendiculatus]
MLLALVLVLMLAVSRSTGDVATDGRSVSDKVDIKEFFDTYEPMWTLNTTRGIASMCVVDVKYNITNEHVIFTKFSTLNVSSIFKWTAQLKGTFSHGQNNRKPQKSTDTYNAMNITYLDDGESFWNEVLVFETRDRNCGVFMVDTGRKRRVAYELRLKNSSIGEGPEKT